MREQHGEGAALGYYEQCAAANSDGVQHGSDVVHPLAHRRGALERIGHAGTPLVEQDKPGESGQSAEEVGQPRLFQASSTCETKPGTRIRSVGPAPTTWYAMLTCPLFAYSVACCTTLRSSRGWHHPRPHNCRAKMPRDTGRIVHPHVRTGLMRMNSPRQTRRMGSVASRDASGSAGSVARPAQADVPPPTAATAFVEVLPAPD